MMSPGARLNLARRAIMLNRVVCLHIADTSARTFSRLFKNVLLAA